MVFKYTENRKTIYDLFTLYNIICCVTQLYLEIRLTNVLFGLL